MISKELRNLLQRLIRRFRDKEERKDRSKRAEDSKEEISTPTDLDNHLGDHNADDEVGEPDHGSSGSNTLCPAGAGEYFSGESPSQWSV
jgi:hypothetical protein